MNSFHVVDEEQHKHLQLAKTLINDAIDDCIPFLEKTAYLEALDKSPHLVDEETNPIWFLSYEK